MKNVNPWRLVAVLAVVMMVYAAVKVFRSPTLEGNLPTKLAEIDSTRVTELVIASAKLGGEQIRLVRSGGWKLMKGERSMRLEQGAGVSTLQTLMRLKPQRMVSRRKERWDEYGVSDSTGTHVLVMADKSTEADLWIGRSGFSQGAGQQYGGSTFTYVRVGEESEVYAVEGYLEGQFNRKADEWRDKTFLRLKRDSVNQIRFRYPGDSSFMLSNINGKWMAGDMLADSSAVMSYLVSMEYRNLSGFAAVTPAGTPPMSVSFEKNAKSVATVESWPGESTVTMRGSGQPDTFFEAEISTAREILAGRSKFLRKAK